MNNFNLKAMKKSITLLTLLASFMNANAIEIVAHRGEFSLAPQNTLSAFKQAWANGAKYVEGDFHLNEQGEIVVIHVKHDVKHLWGIDKEPHKLTLEDLKNSSLKNCPQWAKKYPNEKIPTIEEVFKIIPKDKVLVLEVKKFGKGYVEKVEKLRKENGLDYSNILIISFETEPIKEFKEKYPQYKALWLYAMNKTKTGAFSMPAEKAIKICKDIKADGVDVGHLGSKCPMPTAEYVNAFKSAGLEFWVWTSNNFEYLIKCKEMGINGFTTDISYKMIKFKNNGYKH